MPLNSAFVFVKPHAVTDATKVLVKEGLIASGLTILSEGTITAEEIDEKKLIDQHYYAIASKATILKPNQLNVPSAKFEAQFGLTWEAALAQGNVYNAMDACALLGVTADEMDSQWGICKKAKKLVKFGGGFYCGLIEIEGKPSVYVFNGFFMSMRSKFTAPGESIYYYTVEWDSAALSWADFRGQVLGPTDPAEAPATSLRGKIAAQWKALGLAAEPNVGDNGVHASASPFEALAERLNWCGATLEKDSFGTALVGSGISAGTIKAWCVDPQVPYLPTDEVSKGSLFDALEDMNAGDCLEKCVALASAGAPPVKNSAFVFVKPHAVTDATKVLVKEGLIASGLTILSEGTITAEEIDEKKLIDQHYYAIASKATILKPNQLNVPSAKFEAQFGLTWEAALAQGNVYNAMDACALLGVTADEMDSQWGICKKAKKLVKFGGGFYCGLIEIEGKPSVYVFNGFFMSMRSKFTAPGESIYYYTVEWDSAALSWADFRGQVLGPTDPAEAPATSLRGKIAAQWKALGLAAEPNVGDNGVHASASPFEALAERLNWCGATLEKDSFGTALLGAGVPKSMINSWCVDPQVALADAEGKGSLFDALEDMNANDCILKCRALAVKNVETLYLQDGPEAASLSDYLPFFPFKKIDRFYDISGFLKAPEVFQKIVDIFVERYSILDVDAIGGIDARGFVLGPPIALALKKPFFMLRKPGKMPNCVFSEPYKVEYGTREGLGIQKDAVAKGDRVLLIDDLVATGGTLSAAIECVQMCGGSVVECACIVELKFFREQRMKFYSDLGIADVPVWGLVSEDVLQTAKTVGSDYKDDGEEH